eukprot:638483-Lingulodinium_polyedra.AAC.1
MKLGPSSSRSSRQFGCLTTCTACWPMPRGTRWGSGRVGTRGCGMVAWPNADGWCRVVRRRRLPEEPQQPLQKTFTAQHADGLLDDLITWAPKILEGLDEDEVNTTTFKLEGWAMRLDAYRD